MKVLDLFEGAWVVKNLDGVEKRFKDDKSEAAKQWRMTRSKKKAAPKFTQTWWKQKEDRDYYGDSLYPWTPIDDEEVTMDFLVKQADFTKDGVDHWRITKRETKQLTNQSLRKMIDSSSDVGKALIAKLEKREDLPEVAVAIVRVAVHYTADDDLGHDSDVEESQSIRVTRDPENPKKLVFGGYTW